jgi:hypothetical protein
MQYQVSVQWRPYFLVPQLSGATLQKRQMYLSKFGGDEKRVWLS